MAATKGVFILAVAALLGTSAGAQEVTLPRSSFIRFTNLRILLSPDSSGVSLWASSGGPNGPPPKDFQAQFDPSELITWVSDARWFLDQKAPSNDGRSSMTSAA